MSPLPSLCLKQTENALCASGCLTSRAADTIFKSMGDYFISTDMTADFPPELAEDDFRILPMPYVLDGVGYDGEERAFLSPHDFYAALEEGKTASTSMVPVHVARDYFADMLKEGKDVLHISFPAAMSGCYDGYLKAAKLAESDFPGRKVVVLDGKCASSGEGLLAYYALKKRAEGATIEDNAAYLAELRDHVGHAFTVSDLKHLYRGGRLSRGAAAVGQAIKLNPILMVDENGALVHIGNVMGRKNAMRALTAKMKRESAGHVNDVMIVAHGDCLHDAEFVAEEVKNILPDQRVLITDVGPIIGSHCGKGMLALIYLGSGKTDRRI